MFCSRELLRRQDSCDQWLLISSLFLRHSRRSPLVTLPVQVTFLPSSTSSPPDRPLHFILGAPFLQCVLGFVEYVNTERETLSETVNEIPHQVVAPSHIEHTSHMYRRLELNCGECLGGALSVDCIDFLCDHRPDQIGYWPMTRPVHAKTRFLSVY